MVKLSEMENDVLQKILEGKNSKIIAQELGIKYRSVQRAIERMKQKLMLNSTLEICVHYKDLEIKKLKGE